MVSTFTRCVIVCCLLFWLSSCIQSPAQLSDANPELASAEVPAIGSRKSELLPGSDLLVRAKALAQAMTDRELVGQLIMTGVSGTGSLPQQDRHLVEDLLPGAILLFGYNIPADPLDLSLLQEDLRRLTPPGGLLPFIAVDHEGGTVFRFKTGLTTLPSAVRLAAGGLEAAALAGRIAGRELSAIGISMNLAPVFEALDATNAAFLNSRAWSSDTDTAAALAAAFTLSCQAAGVASVAKHFPGNAALDPHLGLPVLDIGVAELESRYLKAFAKAVSAGTAAVMVSHVLVPAIDPDLPLTLSAPGISLLRDRLLFQGIIMSDDLSMEAIAGARSPSTAAIMALRAGVDMLMISGIRQAILVRNAILSAIGTGQLDREALVASATRILSQKLRFSLDRLDAESCGDPSIRRAYLQTLVHDNRRALELMLTN